MMKETTVIADARITFIRSGEPAASANKKAFEDYLRRHIKEYFAADDVEVEIHPFVMDKE